MDQIIISDLEVFARHGVLAKEKENGQLFYLDIILDIDLSEAGENDCLSSTVNYDDVCRIAGEAMTKESYDLIERAAQYTAEEILGSFPAVEAVDITLKKPYAPICMKAGCVAVRMKRVKSQSPPHPEI